MGRVKEQLQGNSPPEHKCPFQFFRETAEHTNISSYGLKYNFNFKHVTFTNISYSLKYNFNFKRTCYFYYLMIF